MKQRFQFDILQSGEIELREEDKPLTLIEEIYQALNHNTGLQHLDLRGADLSWADLRGANLSHLDLSLICLDQARLEGADLSHSTLSMASLHGASLRKANLRHTNLFGADLRQAFLSKANFENADLTHASLKGSWIFNSKFNNANLSFTNLLGCGIGAAEIENVKLHQAIISGETFKGAALKNPSVKAEIELVKNEFFRLLSLIKDDVPELYYAVSEGKTVGWENEKLVRHGSFIKTVAYVRKEPFDKLTVNLKPDPDHIIERWFRGIRVVKGVQPGSVKIKPSFIRTCATLRLFLRWLEEFMIRQSIEYTPNEKRTFKYEILPMIRAEQRRKLE